MLSNFGKRVTQLRCVKTSQTGQEKQTELEGIDMQSGRGSQSYMGAACSKEAVSCDSVHVSGKQSFRMGSYLS